MRLFRFFPVLLLLAMVVGCSPRVHVSTEYDSSVNFQQYRTYKWYQDRPEATPDSRMQQAGRYDTFMDRRIKAAVEAEMSARGYQKVDQNADMLIAFEVAVDRRQQVTDPGLAYGPGMGFFPGYPMGMGWGMGYRYNYGFNRMWAAPMVREYQEKTVILDVIDRNENELIWRGTGERDLTGRNVSDKQLREIISGILDRFPPGGASPAASR